MVSMCSVEGSVDERVLGNDVLAGSGRKDWFTG